MTRNELQKASAEFMSDNMNKEVADRAAIVACTIFETFYASHHPKASEIRKLVNAFCETEAYFIAKSLHRTAIVETLKVKFGYEEE